MISFLQYLLRVYIREQFFQYCSLALPLGHFESFYIFQRQFLSSLYINLLKMSVVERYHQKRILITGTTGFVGKVLLEKFLFSLSSVDKIFVLIRAKEGSDLFERFKKQIVSSQCFDRLRGVHKGKFDEFIASKVEPIQGDLLKDNLGFSPADEAKILDTCQIIINCAASIDFNARIDGAIDSNIRGSLRMLELSRRVKNLEMFTQISTSYVNCDRRGLIHEEIYEREMTAEDQFRELNSMPLNELIQNQAKIVGKFPNTYTYTKNLCERLMKNRQGSVPLCIIRPSIINTSYIEPFPGWIDSLAAAAALFLFIGLGIVQHTICELPYITDIIPVDIVVASIIVATAKNIGNPKMSILQVGSSDLNPITWAECKVEILRYWNSTISPSKMGRAKVFTTTNKSRLHFQKLKRKIPLEIYQRLSPFLGKQHEKNSNKMMKTLKRAEQVSKLFEFFMTTEWIYECKNIQKLTNQLSAQQKKMFFIDITDYDNRKFIYINNYGIQKYLLKEHAEYPFKPNVNLLTAHNEENYFCDFKWAFNTHMPVRPINQINSKILSSSRVLKAIEYQIELKMEKEHLSVDKARNQVRMEAEKIINELVAEVKVPVMRSMAYSLHKAFKSLYEKITINMEVLEQIRQIERNSQIPIVLLPTHRSYIDFLIISYVFFVYNLRLPNFIADQAILQAKMIPFIIKSCGAFFYQKKPYKNSTLYRIIFDKYLELLLKQGNTLEFFIEGTRSRTGKILAPNFELLSVVLDSVTFGKVPDVCLIPMTVNYQKVLEGATFPGELLGEQLLAQSLWRVIKALPQIKYNHGRVYINICQPVYAKQLINNAKIPPIDMKGSQMRRKCVKVVGKEIIARMTNGIVIMSTALVSSVLLMHRKGISEDELIKTVNELAKYILKKGHKIGGVNQNSSAVAVRNAIGYLEGIIIKTKKNIFELTIKAGSEFQKILMLSYYRNTLTHAFLPEAFVGCSMAAFGEQLHSNEGINLPRIHEQTQFLMSLLRQSYFLQYSLQSYDDFMKVIMQMQDNLVIQLKQGTKVIVNNSGVGSRMIPFYISLIRPQIECYWACLVYIIALSRNHDGKYETSSLDKFFDTIQWYMESLYDEKVIEDYEACSLETIKNAFEKYQKQKLVKLTPGSRKKDSVVQVMVPCEKLEDFESKIKFFKMSMMSSFTSPTEVAKHSLRDFGAPKL